MPSPHAIAVIVIAITAFYLYTRSKLAMELVALLLLVALLVVFFVFPYQQGGERFDDTNILSGFGHPVLIAILCLMILGRGLLMTGALEPAVRVLTRLWQWSPQMGLLLTLIFSATASAFVNDTPVIVLILPMLLGIAERTSTSPKTMLMPVNFAVLAGGMLTAVGTSTNLLVLSIAVDLGMRPMAIFDFTSIAAGALLVALPYLWLIAPRLLPRHAAAPPTPPRTYEARIVLGGADRMTDQTVERLTALLGRPMPLKDIIRDGQVMIAAPDARLQAGDNLVLRDSAIGLREIATVFAAELYDAEGLGKFVDQALKDSDHKIVEAVLGPGSPLCGRSLSETHFAENFGVVAIALQRSDEDLLHRTLNVGDVKLQAGDLLLVQGPESRIDGLKKQPDLMILDSSLMIPRTPLAPWALAIMAGVVILAAFKVLPIHIAAFIGVVAMLLKGCVRLDGVGRALSLEVVLLVASSIALGQSLVRSGAADWLASGVAVGVVHLPAAAQLAVVMAFAALLTNFVSNSAAAAIGTPIAMTLASQFGAPPEPFVLAIMFGANLSYATPMAYQTNMLIMSAAGYSFRDFIRVGTPLVILMLGALSFLLAYHYQL